MKIENLAIDGPAGKLEALLEHDPRVVPKFAALVCHPHPVYGGTMHNKVVYRAAKAAAKLGYATLRFNFRGAGKSEGSYDEGIGEREDVRAALDFLNARFPRAAICLIGFSFGAAVGLAVGATDPRVVALVGIGLPANDLDFAFLAAVRKPTLLVQGALDQYGSRAQVESLFASIKGSKRLQWVEGADHFFAGKLDELQKAVGEFLSEIASASPRAPSSG